MLKLVPLVVAREAGDGRGRMPPGRPPV